MRVRIVTIGLALAACVPPGKLRPSGAGGASATSAGGGGQGGASSSSAGGGAGGQGGAGVVQIALGYTSSCARKADGTVFCWGGNFQGELGDGTAYDQPKPVKVVELSGALEIAVGYFHACARTAAKVSCWGRNEDNQLGSGAPDSKAHTKPEELKGLVGAVELALGGELSCARMSDDTAMCWGKNTPTPTKVNGLSDVARLAVGFDHACALTKQGQVRCWGSNNRGQLGIGVTDPSTTPVDVTLSDVVELSCSAFRSCARTGGGKAFCWGSNDFGAIGNGKAGGDETKPAAVPNLDGVAQIAAGDAHTCALMNDGTARCWGYNAYGRLGIGSADEEPHADPKAVVGLSGATAIALGGHHACALDDKGAVRCWGHDFSGELGDDRSFDAAKPVALTVTASALALGDSHSCLLDGGAVKCWGHNDVGQLGDGTTQDRPAAAVQKAIAGLPSADEIAVGFNHGCARTGGNVWCWGRNDSGQLGDNTINKKLAPVQVSGLGDAVQIAAGGAHSCARKSDATVVCWGKNDSGELGDGSTAQKNTPAPVMGLTGVSQIAAGRDSTCARTPSGLYCWGKNDAGQLGDATLVSKSTPTAVKGLAGAEVALGNAHTCARKDDGTAVWCWGYGNTGALGGGNTDDQQAPVMIPSFAGATAIALGGQHTCARMSDESLSCWGDDYHGQLGDGAVMAGQSSPQAVPGLAGVLKVKLGNEHSCAIKKADKSVWCWGANYFGQIGDGATGYKPTPVAVKF